MADIELILDSTQTLSFEAEVQGVNRKNIIPRFNIITEDGYKLAFDGKMNGDQVEIDIPILASTLPADTYKCSLEFIMEGERFAEVMKGELEAYLPVKVGVKNSNKTKIPKYTKPNVKVSGGKVEHKEPEVETAKKEIADDRLVKFKGDMIETKNMPVEIKSIKDDGTFVGYGSMFGNIDSYRDIVEKGAFKKTLKERKNVKLLWQHNSDDVIGVFDKVYEDDKGLIVEGRIALGVQKGKEAHELMKMGAIDGLSIGYSVIQDEYNSKEDIRYLKELKLYEVSIVTFPANEAATVSAVKAGIAQLDNTEQEALLDFVKTLHSKTDEPLGDHSDEPGIAHSLEPEAEHLEAKEDSSERKQTETVDDELVDLLTKLKG